MLHEKDSTEKVNLVALCLALDILRNAEFECSSSVLYQYIHILSELKQPENGYQIFTVKVRYIILFMKVQSAVKSYLHNRCFGIGI